MRSHLKRSISIPFMVAVLAACQGIDEVRQAGETVESLSILVETIEIASGDLDGQTVSGQIIVSVPQEGWMKEVRFFLDGRLLQTMTAAPFEVTIDTTGLQNGAHTFGVEARMANGRVRVSTLTQFHVQNGITSIQPTPLPFELSSFSLRGNATFARSQLTSEQSYWYERLWADINSSGTDLDPMSLAARDNLYHYGRTLHTYVQSILIVFRMTGDLKLLDHVDEIAERMRAELRDGWRDTLDGTNGTRDGYLNWVYRYGSSASSYGKDLDRSNEMRTHSMIATIAYALHLNRDLPSPTGRNYGAHADFWQDYLVNHFEAKWRERRNIPTGFPIMIRPHTHTYYSWLKWHYYMGALTGNTAYTDEANRMADVLWNELRTVTTPSGPAYIWARSVLSEGGTADYLHPTTYARYVYSDIVELHLEGFHNWGKDEHMPYFARTFTEFVMDQTDPLQNGFAADIGGGEAIAGLQSDPDWNRMSADRYRISAYALIGAWDDTRSLTSTTQSIEHALRSRNTSLLASGLFVDSWLRPASPSALTARLP